MPAQGDDTSANIHLRLSRQLCFPLYAATNLIQRLYRPLLAPFGLTYSQYLVMLVLWERKKLSIGDIQDCLHLDVGTLSPLLKRMEGVGLVTRSRDPEDERRVLVTATSRGKALEAQVSAIPGALQAQIAGASVDLEQLYVLSTALVSQMNANRRTL